MAQVEHSFDDIVASMKRCVAALREEEVPFLLAGSLAVWAQGGDRPHAMDVRVMALEDVMHSKLTAIDEHCADFSGLIGLARAVREQVDWEDVRRRTEESPFARGFFVVLEGLDVLPADATVGR